MPLISAHLIDRLIETFAPDRGHLIAVPVSEGRRGNPVLWSRRFFRELMTLDGDVGARHLIAKHAEAVAEVPSTATAPSSTSTRRPRWKPREDREGYRLACRVGKAKACPPSSCVGRMVRHGASAPLPTLHIRIFNLPFTKWKLPPARFAAGYLGDWGLDRFDCRRAAPRVVRACADFIAGRVALYHGDLGGRRLCGRQMRRLWPGVRLSRGGRGRAAALKQCKGNCTTITMKRACAALRSTWPIPAAPMVTR